MKMNNQKGITILSLIILVVIVAAGILYGPKLFNYVIDINVKRLVTANAKSVETEIRSELLTKHPIQIWNNIDSLINGLNFMNPVNFERQAKNGWNRSGDVVVSFDGINTFRLDGIGRDGSSLCLNILMQKTQ